MWILRECDFENVNFLISCDFEHLIFWTKSVILPQCEDQGRIVVIRIYTPTTVHRRRFLAKSPDRLLNAIYLYLESLGHLQEDTEDNLKTFDSKLTRRDLQDFLAKGGGALYLNKRTH